MPIFPLRLPPEQMDLSSLAEYRFWLKNPATAVVTHGYVLEITESSVSLELTNDSVIEVGQTWICSITHPQWRVQFLLLVRHVDGKNLECVIVSGLNVKEATEDARRRMPRTEQLVYEGESLLVELQDISAGGVCVLVPISLHKGVHVECIVQAADGEIRLPGKVVYARPEDGTVYHRCGIVLDLLDRITAARWNVFLSDGERVIASRRGA